MEALKDENYRLLNAKEVAEILNVSKALVYKLIQSRRIICVKINSSRRVMPEDLEEYIERNKSELEIMGSW